MWIFLEEKIHSKAAASVYTISENAIDQRLFVVEVCLAGIFRGDPKQGR
jgi:hypothetical protein